MPTTLIFSLAVFCGALLLFLFQPMVGKGVLPLFGGASQVWITCLLFFQTALLAGYFYAHLLATRVARRFQAPIHILVAAAGLFFLPVAIPPDAAPPPDASPALTLLALLARAIGLPALAVAATAPLAQRWFSRTGHPAARDPYFLYAASNLGSLAALLAYPALVEPSLGLAAQGRVWTLLYLALLALLAMCGISALRGETTVAPGARDATSADIAPIATKERLIWLALSFAPASLLLGLTSHVTADLVSAPLLWVAPLALYLGTFVIAFARRPLIPRRASYWLQAFAIAALVAALIAPDWLGFWPILAAHVAAFAFSALACHHELAARRPPAARLTEFYLWLAAGGVLGGAFNALLAPLAFDDVFEYPLALALVCWLRATMPARHVAERRAVDVAIPSLIAINLILQSEFTRLLASNFGFSRAYSEDIVLGVIGALAALAIVHAVRRPIRFALIASIVLILWQFPVDGGNVERLASQRSFYGVVRVERHPGRGMNLLLHGTTVHGGQAIDATMRLEPVTYYLRSGPFGDVFASRTAEQIGRPVAVIGLGVGGLACHGRPEARWTFYEIDPLVERIARDERFFTYLRDCPPRKEVVLGDARLSLRAAPDGAFGLIFMDAFSSDSIPIHLLTREALESYLAKLAPDGMIVFNISHRILDLAPVLSTLAADSGLAMRISRLRRLRPPIEERYGYTVDVAIMAREPRHLGGLARHPRWTPPPAPKGRVWTDDYSNPLALLPWY